MPETVTDYLVCAIPVRDTADVAQSLSAARQWFEDHGYPGEPEFYAADSWLLDETGARFDVPDGMVLHSYRLAVSHV